MIRNSVYQNIFSNLDVRLYGTLLQLNWYEGARKHRQNIQEFELSYFVAKKKIETERVAHGEFTLCRAEPEKKREGKGEEKLEVVLDETTA